MNEEEDAEYVLRWEKLLDGLADRVDPDELEEMRYAGLQVPWYGISGLIGGHEQGQYDLTPDEEDEAWELATLTDCSDEQLVSEGQRAASIRNRPIRKVRPKHPLRGGGHGARTGQPGKRVFPQEWTDDEAIDRTMDVARQPSEAVKLPTGEFLAHGERAGVLLGVVVSPDGEVLTSYPVAGPGVTQNPMDEFRGPAAQRLQELLHAVLPEGHDLRAVMDELHDVGEWPYVVATLRALDLPMTDHQRSELTELTRVADLPDPDA